MLIFPPPPAIVSNSQGMQPKFISYAACESVRAAPTLEFSTPTVSAKNVQIIKKLPATQFPAESIAIDFAMKVMKLDRQASEELVASVDCPALSDLEAARATLESAYNEAEYEIMCSEVRAMGLDPNTVPHRKVWM